MSMFSRVECKQCWKRIPIGNGMRVTCQPSTMSALKFFALLALQLHNGLYDRSELLARCFLSAA